MQTLSDLYKKIQKQFHVLRYRTVSTSKTEYLREKTSRTRQQSRLERQKYRVCSGEKLFEILIGAVLKAEERGRVTEPGNIYKEGGARPTRTGVMVPRPAKHGRGPSAEKWMATATRLERVKERKTIEKGRGGRETV